MTNEAKEKIEKLAFKMYPDVWGDMGNNEMMREAFTIGYQLAAAENEKNAVEFGKALLKGSIQESFIDWNLVYQDFFTTKSNKYETTK